MQGSVLASASSPQQLGERATMSDAGHARDLSQSSRDINAAHRLSLSSSCSASSAKKALFMDDTRAEALGEISLNALNSAASVASSASCSPRRDSTPHGAGKSVTDAPRSVLRRRTPGHPTATTGHISFNPTQTNFEPSPSSLVKHSPRPPRWPAAQSPWLHRGTERSDGQGHTATPRWEATPKNVGFDSDIPYTTRSQRTSATADNNRTVQDELLAMRVAYCNMCGAVLLVVLGTLLYAQGLMLSQYYKPLILAGFVGTALRRPVRYVAEMLRWSSAESSGPQSSGPQTAGQVEMPEWKYWRWLGAAYIASSLLNFPGRTVTAALVLLSVYSGVMAIVRAVQTTWIAKEMRQQISDWRHVLAKLTVVMSFFLLVIIGLSLCAYNLVTELKMLRSFALDGSMHSHTVAAVNAVTGWSEEEIAIFVREKSVMLSDYMRTQFEDLVGDKHLASDLEEQVLRPFVLEALQFQSMNATLTPGTSAANNSAWCGLSSANAAGLPTSGCSNIDSQIGLYNTNPTLKSFEEIYSGAIGSSLLFSEQTQQILSRLLVHTYRLLLEGVGYAMAGIDFLFSCTLFASWLWMCLDDDAIECTIVRFLIATLGVLALDCKARLLSNCVFANLIYLTVVTLNCESQDRVLVGADTAARFKSVLATTAGILDSLAHTFLFHCALAWLVFLYSSVRLQWTCSFLAGLLSITPVFSPWAMIFAPLVLRIWTITVADSTDDTGAYIYSASTGSTMLSVWAELDRTELCVWVVAICAWVSGKTQRLLSRSIATRTHQLVGETTATQAILLGFYAFGVPGIAIGPVLLAMTNGLVKIYRDSVVFPLCCSAQFD